MFTTVNQIKMFYQDSGKGLPVVLLHGYPLNHTIWAEVTSHLESKARVISPDLRGHGLTDAPPGVYTMRQMAADVAALLDGLEIQQAVLVGHSMGGYISLAFAQAYPDRLLGLGMVSSQAAADPPERREGRYQTAAQVEKEGVGVVANSMPDKLTNRAALAEYLRQLILTMKPAGVVGALKGMAKRPEMGEWISTLSVPVMVIAGGQDGLVPLDRAREMAQRFPHGHLTICLQSGHMPMMEAPQEVAAALEQLVNDVENGGFGELIAGQPNN